MTKIDVGEKLKFDFGRVEKYCGKRIKCWLPAFYPFPTVSSKGFYHRDVRSRYYMVKG